MSNYKGKTEKLPDGWIVCESKSTPGRKYFFNRKTGKSSWTSPQGLNQSGNNKKRIKKCKVQKVTIQNVKKALKRRSDGVAEEKKTAKQGKTVEIESVVEKNTSAWEKASPADITPTRNLANSRLQRLRESLNAEIVKNDELSNKEDSPRKTLKHKITSNSSSEVPTKVSKLEFKSPNIDSKCCTITQSPCSDSFQSSTSPSQFFAANKILFSMKSQLPDEYKCKVVQKNAFSDIEEGIYNQISEYPSTKHPATPPQFSEASKLLSAIKSKLSYNVKDDDIRKFSSAKDRMEALRSNLNEDLNVSENIVKKTNTTTTTVSEIIKQPNEQMDVDDKQIKSHTCTEFNKLNGGGRKEDLVLVVDTNIFIHKLDCIKNVLNSHIKGYSMQPTLLVPWRVINELDRLKDNNNGNGAICKRARSAMDYLYKLLPENSRIKGQSLRDANSHIYPCESPDDEILNCCLQQKEREKDVILLSSDKNLCGKAAVNNVKCMNIDQLNASLESKPQPKVDPDIVTNMEHYKNTIFQLLSNILENEMRATYNNLWQHMLFKAPPWNLRDVLQCLLKHWIAVFSDVFPRIEHLITDLKNTLVSIENKNPITLSDSEVANFKDLCLDVAKRCQIIPEYMYLAKITVDRLERKSVSETVVESELNTDMVVIDVFEGVWTVFSSYCAKLASGLGISHSIEDKLVTNDSLQVLVDRYPVFSSQICMLTNAISGVLTIEDMKNSITHERLRNLETVFKESLALIHMDSNQINIDNLRIFLVKSQNMLQEAYKKFFHLTELLEICKENITHRTV